MKKLTTYFSKSELTLWGSSAGLILVSFFLFDRVNFMTLAASLIGTTSLIFNAKGNPIGQALMIVFSLLYGAISYTFSYFGEMITYLGMTAPMALFALITWLQNPYKGNRAEVAVNRIGKSTGNSVVLFYSGALQYSKHTPKHSFCGHQLHRSIPYLPPESILRSGLCRQRCSADRPVDISSKGEHQLFICHHLLFDVSGK